MTRALIIRPEAEADLAEAAAWYARVGHEPRFEQRISDALTRIATGPLQFPVIYDDVRRALVRRYPYAIFFVTETDRVVVLAILHQRRDPARWPSR